MDHINSYFSGINKNLLKKNLEREAFVSLVKNITSIEIENKDFEIKNNLVKLKLFGPKKHKIVSNQDRIIEDMKKEGFIILRLE